MPTPQQTRFAQFQALHAPGNCFVAPNPWDAGSARLLTQLGFQALATTSAGYAFAQGKRDSFGALCRDEIIANAAQIVAATDLPVTADLENGFGHAPEACATTIRDAISVGLVGGSIEDATGDPDTPIYDLGASVERIHAAVEAATDQPFLLTARAENFLWGRPDLDNTIARLNAYAEAGADVLYAPGLRDLDSIRTLCANVDKPVNVVMGLSGPSYSVDDLADAGVTRISTGGSLARAAWGAFLRAAEGIVETGRFDYAKDAIPNDTIADLMSPDAPFRKQQ